MSTFLLKFDLKSLFKVRLKKKNTSLLVRVTLALIFILLCSNGQIRLYYISGSFRNDGIHLSLLVNSCLFRVCHPKSQHANQATKQ